MNELNIEEFQVLLKTKEKIGYSKCIKRLKNIYSQKTTELENSIDNISIEKTIEHKIKMQCYLEFTKELANLESENLI